MAQIRIGHFLQNDAYIYIYTMLFKSYEHFHLLTTDGPTQTAIIVHTCGSCTLNTCYEDTVKRFGGYILG